MTVHQRAAGWSLALVVALSLSACAADDGPATDDAAGPPDDRAPGHEHDHGDMVVLDTIERADGRLEIHYGDHDGNPAAMVEVTEHDAGAGPTAAEQQAADDLVGAVRRAAQPFERIEDAEAAGYRRWPGIDEFHLVHPDHVADGEVLDPRRPEFLMYDGSGVLVAAMFLAGGNADPGPQLGGPLTVWHYHPWGPSCWAAGGLLPSDEVPDDDGTCPAGLLYSERSPEMLHVWVIDHPGGPFSSDMGDVLLRATG